MTTKICICCLHELPLSEFRPAQLNGIKLTPKWAASDGTYDYCVTCTKDKRFKLIKKCYRSQCNRGTVLYSLGWFTQFSLYDESFNKLWNNWQDIIKTSPKDKLRFIPSIDAIKPRCEGGVYEMGNIQWLTLSDNVKIFSSTKGGLDAITKRGKAVAAAVGKPVICSNASTTVEFESCAKAATYVNSKRKTVALHARSGKPLNGWTIKYKGA